MIGPDILLSSHLSRRPNLKLLNIEADKDWRATKSKLNKNNNKESKNETEKDPCDQVPGQMSPV